MLTRYLTTPVLLWSLATARCKVIPGESVAVKGDLKEGPVIGSGPWIFDSFQPNQASAMKRNPDYYFEGQPYLDGVTWLRIADQATLLNAFRSKNLDVLHTGFTKIEIDDLKKQNPELRLRLTRQLAFCTSKDPELPEDTRLWAILR